MRAGTRPAGSGEQTGTAAPAVGAIARGVRRRGRAAPAVARARARAPRGAAAPHGVRRRRRGPAAGPQVRSRTPAPQSRTPAGVAEPRANASGRACRRLLRESGGDGFGTMADLQREELDRLWEKLSAGGEKVQCGWAEGQGLRAVLAGRPDHPRQDDERPGSRPASRVLQAVMGMVKLDIKQLEEAYGGRRALIPDGSRTGSRMARDRSVGGRWTGGARGIGPRAPLPPELARRERAARGLRDRGVSPTAPLGPCRSRACPVDYPVRGGVRSPDDPDDAAGAPGAGGWERSGHLGLAFGGSTRRPARPRKPGGTDAARQRAGAKRPSPEPGHGHEVLV